MDDYRYFHPNPMPQYKSRVERQIGDLLTERSIPFIYEKPTAVIDNGLTKLWHPDYSLQYGLLIEYFGVNGDQSYTKQARHKLRVYHENQYEVIPVYPPDITGPWERNLLDRIGYALERRLSDYRERIR